MNTHQKNVLFIITKSDAGGAQKYVRDLAEHLNTNAFSCHVLYGGIDIRWLSNRVWWWFLFVNDWLAVAELVRLLKREMPDILHLNSSKAGVLGALATRIYNSFYAKKVGKRTRVIFTAHGWVFNPVNRISPISRYAYILLHRFAARFQDAIICVSEYDRVLALKHLIAPPEKLITIHNGIDPSLPFLNRDTARRELISKLAHSPTEKLTNAYWVGSIGRLTKEKDYVTLIATAALVPGAYFFIIGDGLEREYLKSQISDLRLDERFFIVPPEGDDWKYLKAFDAFALSSVKEGFPYVMLEAMAAEVPVVATDAGGVPEAVIHEKTGLLTPRKDPRALARAIERFRRDENLRAICIENASNVVREKFSRSRMVERTADASLAPRA